MLRRWAGRPRYPYDLNSGVPLVPVFNSHTGRLTPGGQQKTQHLGVIYFFDKK